MSPEDVYANIVSLYDLEHGDYTDDIELLLELAALGRGPILELGCGTGRVLLPLAEAGHEVMGIDSSEAMLDVARAQMRDKDIRLVAGDMTDVSGIPGGPFGIVIASLNSIMHLTSQASQREMIMSAWNALLPGGRLVIDTLNPNIGQLNHLLNTTHLEGSWKADDGTMVDKWGHRELGSESQVIDTLIWYDQTSADGRYHRTRTRFDLRYVHQSELALLLELAGFSHVDWYGDYELTPWDAESDRIIVVAHKEEE